MTKPRLENRKEERSKARGPVKLFLEEPPVEISARLLDVSKSGFRASHHYPALCPGQELRFRDVLREGRARLIWTRILPDHVESGFFVLET